MSAMGQNAILRRAVGRDGGLCVTCGRPCGATEVRQRLVPDTAPDDPLNWVAMCSGCQEALIGRMPPPARFVYHVHDRTKLRRQCYEIGRFSMLAITAATWIGFAALLGYLMYLGADGVGWHLMTMLSAFFLVAWAWKFFDGYYHGANAPAQPV